MKMKKVLLLILAVAMVVACFAGCGTKESNNPETTPTNNDDFDVVVDTDPLVTELPQSMESYTGILAQIKSEGQLVVATSADYPPYEFIIYKDNKEQYVGFDIELAKCIADELGVKLVIKNIGFDGILPALAVKKAHIAISCFTPDEDRKENFDFSNIYYQAGQSVIIRKADAEKYTSIDSLAGFKVGAQMSTTQQDIVTDQMSGSVGTFLQKVPDLILSLTSGKVEAVVCETPVAKAYVSKYDTLMIADIEVVDEIAGAAVCIPKGNEDLVALINTVIKNLQDSGKIDTMFEEAWQLSQDNS